MKIISHKSPSPDEDLLRDIREAVQAASETLAARLRNRGVADFVFVMACCQHGQSLTDVQLASNLPPEMAREFLEILGRPEPTTQENLQ